jgi:hypothetical protein
MRQDGDEITMTMDELVHRIRTIQEVERWITKPMGDVVFLPKAKPLPNARSFLDHLKAFEERFKMEAPSIEKLAFDLLAQLENLPKLEGKVTGDGSAWIVSSTFEQKNKSDLMA